MLPVKPEVAAACELLGLDPLYVAVTRFDPSPNLSICCGTPMSGLSSMSARFGDRCETLSSTLMHSRTCHQIGYERIAALGGLRGKSRGDLPKCTLTGATRAFIIMPITPWPSHSSMLRELGHAQRCAIMCAEALWWRCHSRIIADYLIAAGETVCHSKKRLSRLQLNPARMAY
jgi:Protein of unknown function, DUF488